jgi:hypothetical protein
MKSASHFAELFVFLAALFLSAPIAHADSERDAAGDKELPEPPPAPLVPGPLPASAPAVSANREVKKIPPPPSPRESAVETARFYNIGAWTGVGVTLALVVTGTVLGVLAQHRSDDLSLATVQRPGGVAPIYDAEARDAYETLQREGRAFSRVTIASFCLAGVTAVASGLLFWDATRINKSSAGLALRPSFSGKEGMLTLSGRF